MAVALPPTLPRASDPFDKSLAGEDLVRNWHNRVSGLAPANGGSPPIPAD
jgi:hypothetical protein